MHLPVIRYLLSNEMIHALFWTLLHSLWQGVLFAIVTGLTLTFTRRSSSALRYNMLCGILLLFIAGIVLTFYCELNLTTKNIIANTSSNIGYDYFVAAGINDKQHIIERLILFVESNEDIIVLSWFLIIAFKCVRLLSGLRTIYILKHKHVFEAGEYWSDRLKELAKKIHVETPVSLLRSAIARIPMVAGHFKPVILFPAAMLSTLPEKEIEAILLHELAHIRRKDYFVNMLQSFAEIIFFFNPAVLWISSLIKDERENCCDDIAMGEIKNKKQFIHALLSFEECHIDSKYAASFPGRKNHLVNRVKRIITNNNKTLNNMEKIFLASGILVTCLILVSFSENRQLASSQKQNTIQISKVDEPLYRTDTVPKTGENNTVHNKSINESSSIISTSMDGKHYKVVEVNGTVTELYIDNVRIPDDKIGQYKTTIDKIHQQVKADQKKQADQMKLQEKQLTAQAETMKQKELIAKEQMEKQTDQMKIQQKQMIEQSELMKQKEELMKENFEKQADQMKVQQKQIAEQSEMMKQKELLMKEAFEKQAEQMKVQQKEMAGQSEMMKEQTEKQAEQMKMKEEEMKALISKHQEELEKQKEQQKQLNQQLPDTVNQSKPVLPKDAIKPITRDEVAYRVNREVTYRVNREILRNHVIRYPRNFSFTRTNKQLTINRQPEQLF